MRSASIVSFGIGGSSGGSVEHGDVDPAIGCGERRVGCRMQRLAVEAVSVCCEVEQVEVLAGTQLG